MKTIDHLQTMAFTYQEICRGERPWVALGNFMNDWFDYAKERRTELVTEPIIVEDTSNSYALRWATFCAASVEWLCERYQVPCPSWVHSGIYSLPEPWFDAPQAHNPQVRTLLVQQTPEPFSRRNIYCGNRMFANKYEFAQQYRRRFVTSPSPTPEASKAL
jgi:hypothetical protein